MPKKITAITPEQSARFAEWSKQWIEIGLSTEPADFDRATAAALEAYRICNLKKPIVVLRMGSPFAATVGGAMAWAMLREFFGSQVWSQVWSQVGSLNLNFISEGVNNDRGAQFWASWAAYVSFFRDVLGWQNETLSAFKIDEDLARSCGWVWWHENVLAISDRPRALNRDAEGRLHCETGPSIAYPDGWALYHWHGTAVPKEWIENRASLTPQAALTWQNIEQRRAACEILGWNAILSALDAKTIDRDGDPQIGELVEVSIPDIGRERFLRVRCGTGREFALPVPPDMKTALQANAWTFGFDDFRQFLKPEIRT